MNTNRRLASFTLGCKVNQYDTEGIRADFLKNGFELVPFKAKADVYLINTCTVTAKSDKESKYVLRQAIRLNPEAKIIITGCLAQRCPELLADFPGVVVVAGNPDKETIFSLYQKALVTGETQVVVSDNRDKSIWSNLKIEGFHRHTRAFVKIQDGCEANCHYCIVPSVRGKSVSRPFSGVKEEIRRLINNGFKEIVLTGIRLGLYGKDLNPPATLSSLLEELEAETELLRIRLSSLEANEFTQELIEQISRSQKVCPHFHLPLQSGDNQILQRMGRTYTREEYFNLVKRIKQEIPPATFSTDIMVGFPGEEERHFKNTVDLIRDIGFIHLHIFSFSPRELTPAANFSGQIPLSIKIKRSQKLHRLDEELKREYWARQIDRELEVLVEKKDKQGNLTGLTRNYFRLRFPGEESLINQLIKVRIGRFAGMAAVVH